jgi:pimeloyl-ACP methyl ester carboxylesterase
MICWWALPPCAGLLAQLGIGRVVLVGHSAGALVAMALQQRRPGAVAGLVLVAPAVPTTPEHAFARRATLGAQLRLALTRAVLQSDAAGLAFVRRQLLRRRDEVAAGKLGFTPQAQAAADAPGDTAAQVPEEIIEGYLRPLKAVDWDRAALLNLRAFSLPPSFDYASVAAPVLVVQGAHDGGLTRNADALVGLLRQRPHGAVTEFVALECGHVPMDELPDAFNAALAAFVRRHALPGGGGEQAAAGQ